MRLPFLKDSQSWRHGVFFCLYARQGIPAGFASTALANWLTSRGVSPDAVGVFVAWTGLPWALQFVWGPLIDRYQGSAMGRRRPWVLGAQLLGLLVTLPLLAVEDPAGRIRLISWVFLVHGLVASVQDTAVDAMAISMAPDRDRGRVNAFMRAGFIAGTGAGSMLSVVMAGWGFRAAVALQSLALGLTALLVFVVRERPGDALLPARRASTPGEGGPGAGPPVVAIFRELRIGLLAPASLRLFGVVATAYLAASVFIRALSVHLIRGSGWGDSELSVFSGTFGSLAALGVVAAGGWLSDRIGHRRLLFGVLMTIGVFLVGFAGPGPWWSGRPTMRAALATWYTFDPLLSVAAMPALMTLCRPGVEGSQFTAYMALVNLCDVLGSYLAGLASGRASTAAIALACGVAVLLAAAAVPARAREATPEGG